MRDHLILNEGAFDVFVSKYVPKGSAYVARRALGDISLQPPWLYFDRDWRDADSPIYEQLVSELNLRPLPRSPLDDPYRIRARLSALLGFPPVTEIVRLADYSSRP